MNWLKLSQTPVVFSGTYQQWNGRDEIGELSVHINGKLYKFLLHPSEKARFETLLRYNKGRALAYLRQFERTQ